MTDVMQLRPTLALFAQAMEERLRNNDHKGGWEHDSDIRLVARLMDEAGELIHSLEAGDPIDYILAEAADVANLAMMLADPARLNRPGTDTSA